MRLAAIAAACALLGSAHAAPISYAMTLFNEFGVQNGTGTVSFDPEVKIDLFMDDFDLCTPSMPDDQSCRFLANWTPLSLVFEIEGVTFDLNNQFLEGYYQPPSGRSQVGTLNPGGWGFQIQSADGPDGIIFYPIDFDARITYEFFNLQLLPGRDEFETFVGSATFERLGEIPLPGAAWLFMAGFGALAFRRRTPLEGRNRAPW